MIIDQIPVMGSITAIRYMKFDFHKQYWAEVKTVAGGAISARLCPEDLPRFEFEGYDTSQWGVQRNRNVKLSQPIYASFIFDGLVFVLCEVLLSDPIPAPELADEALEARLLAELCYRNVSCQEASLWLDLHPEASPDLLWMFGDKERRAEIDRMYLLPPHLREPEYNNDFDRMQWKDWEVNTSK